MSKKNKYKKRRSKKSKSKSTLDLAGSRQTEQKTETDSHKGKIIGVLFAFFVPIIVFLVYSNSIHGPFIFDDINNILDNNAIKLTNLSIESILSAGFDSPHPRRFLAYMTFALNYYFYQDGVESYHIVNILIHCITGFLIYFFTRATLSLSPLSERYPKNREIAIFVTIIWLLHPMAAQSVAYMVQRMNSLAAMFYMLSLLSYVHGRISTGNSRRLLWFLACITSGLLSFSSKEIAVTLPFFIVLYEWYFFQDLKLTFLKRWPLLVCLVIVVTAIVVLLPSASDFLAGYNRRPFTLGERVFTQFRVVVFYISLLVFPHPSRLTINHDFSLSHGLFDPITTLFSMAFVIGLLVLAIYTAKKERLISFCILWYLGHLVIESSIIPLELVFEHRTYLPSIGLFLLLVAQFYRYTRSKNLQFVPLGIIVITLSFWAHERSAVWADSVAFWTDTIKKTPKVARLYNNLGVAHEENGDLDKALNNYTTAYSLDRGFYRAVNNIGLIHLEKKNFEEALRAFNGSKKINPDDVDAYKGLALTYHAMKDQAKYLEFLKIVQEMERTAVE